MLVPLRSRRAAAAVLHLAQAAGRVQAWWFRLLQLLPYVARIPGAESDASQSQGQAVIDTELYMWLNFVTTAACGVGALATIKVEVRAPGLLCVLQSAW